MGSTNQDVFIGNFFAGKELKRWLIESCSRNGKLDASSLAVIVGPVGCGKTYGVEKMCKMLNKTLHIFDGQLMENFKDVKDKLVKLTKSNVATQFRTNSKEDNVVLIDALETLLTMDRSFLHSLQKLIDGNVINHIPMIITVQSSERKKIFELFPKALLIELATPNDTDLLLFLRQERPNIHVDTLTEICDQCNGNLSVALRMLEMEDSSTQIDGQPMLEVNSARCIDTIFTLSDVYLHAQPSAAKFVFYEDPWLHPLRFHENLLQEWGERKGLVAKKQMIYLNMMNCICMWDVFMSHFKGGDLQIPTEFIAQSVIYLTQVERKKTAKPPAHEFTKMFSHMSLEKKNQMSLYESKFDRFGSYYKSLIDQNTKTKKSKKSFLPTV